MIRKELQPSGREPQVPREAPRCRTAPVPPPALPGSGLGRPGPAWPGEAAEMAASPGHPRQPRAPAPAPPGALPRSPRPRASSSARCALPASRLALTPGC